MTTERTIEIYNDYDRISGIILRGNGEEETKYNCETIEALQSINVILHKYQQIEKLINSWELGLIDNIGHEIEEVLEDGNDD